jgi:hypothetical protein
MRARILAALALAAGAACAPKLTYQWGNYDRALYDLARAPENQEQYVQQLREIVTTCETEGTKVPPGIYAEYGYALFTLGQLDQAIGYYEKERATWPESNVFMEKMIRNTKRLRENRPPSPNDGPQVPPPGAPAGTDPGEVRS